MKKFKILMDINLIKYLSDGSVINSDYGPLLISQEDNGVIVVDFQSGYELHLLKEKLTVYLSSDNVSDILDSWYSKNRLLKIYTGYDRDRGHYWLSERLNVTETKNTELIYLKRDSKYQSMAVYGEKVVTFPRSLGGYHSSFALLSDIKELSIPNEEDINYFKEYYTPTPNFGRLIAP